MRSKLIAFMLASALPSACAPSVVHDQQSSLFNPVEYGTQASRGDVPVIVLGSAAGVDGARLSDAVVARMQGADWPPHARFVSARPAAPLAVPVSAPPSFDRSPYSYVLLFNGPSNVTSATLCASRAPPADLPAARTGGTVLVVGLCRYDEVVSGVTARAGNVTGPDDPMFRDLIVSSMLELTRSQGRQHNTSSDGKDKS